MLIVFICCPLAFQLGNCLLQWPSSYKSHEKSARALNLSKPFLYVSKNVVWRVHRADVWSKNIMYSPTTLNEIKHIISMRSEQTLNSTVGTRVLQSLCFALKMT